MNQSQKTKSIIHVADYAPTYSGNFIASLTALAETCRAHGLRTVWVLPEKAHKYDWVQNLAAEQQSPIYALSRNSSPLINGWKLAKIASAENAALIHTHFSFFDISSVLAKLICAFRGKSFDLVWHTHSAFPAQPSRIRLLKDFLKLGILGRWAYAIPVSEDLKRSLAIRGFSESQITVVTNCIDVEHATARTKGREELRREIGVADDTKMLLGFGWTPIRKGVDTMLEAFATLSQQDSNIELVLVGTDELKKFIQDWRDRSCLSRVHVIPPVEYIADLFGAADIFLSPSRAEGWPYSVAEAMANGVPVAAADIPALDWAIDVPGIWLSKPGDPQGLTDNILRILNMPVSERIKIDQNSKKLISERYSVQSWSEKIWTVYERLLPSNRFHSVEPLSVTNSSSVS